MPESPNATLAETSNSGAPASAVPRFFLENLPPYLRTRPATTEAVWAAIIAVLHETGTALAVFYGSASTIGADHWPLIITYAQHFNWLPVIAAAVFPAIRGRVAFVKAKAPTP